MNREIKRIGIVGAGNLAWHLGVGLNQADVEIVGVYNRSRQNAEMLATHLNTKVVSNFRAFRHCDLILLTVSDDAIKELAGEIPQFEGIVAHTSGNTALEILFPHKHIGVFYPVQTFSKDIDVNLRAVPFLVEGNSDEVETSLQQLAGKLSKEVYKINSQQRRRLHVAAVFANNFTNHMLKQAHDICETNDIPFSVLSPLIQETIDKLKTVSPAKAQTGPAIRRDMKTIKIHKDLLEGNSLKLYDLITKDMLETYK